MKHEVMDARSERILELLAKGSSSRDLAEKLGYQEGTMRVYLHHLYRRLGVANKTEAVIWYMKRGQARAAAEAEPPPPPPPSTDILGEMAVREGLYAALGAMSAMIGPFGRLWEVARRLNGDEDEEEERPRREYSRGLFKALLQGDFAAGKRAWDAGEAEDLLVRSPSDAVQLASLLLLGGYSSAGQRLVAQLAQRRRAGGASVREMSLLRALVSLVEEGNGDAASEIQSLAAQKSAGGTRQVAMVVLFHAFVVRKELDRARKMAETVWNEADSVRQQLVAMGERPFGGGRATAERPAAKAAAREKASAR